MIPFPPKKYAIIYADPPWSYNNKAPRGSAAGHYDTQSNTWIADLPVLDIAAPDCLLFMWITLPKLPECLAVLDAWGFKYKTTAFVWIKHNTKTPSLFWGMGYWTRSNAEICVLGVRGKPKRRSAGVHSVILSAIDKHSKKPAETRDRIVKLAGDLPRIELFARESSPGWDAWGNQI